MCQPPCSVARQTGKNAQPLLTSRKHSQHDYLLKNRRGTAPRISKVKLPPGWLSQKSKRHRYLTLESQTHNRIAFSKIEEAPLSESRKPDSQQDFFLKNRRGTVLRISRTRSPTRLLVRKPKRHRSPNFESQISLDKAYMQSSHATSAFQIPQTTFSKCSNKVKTRESCSSHYIAITEKGKGTALLLAVGTIPIYVDFHPPQPGKPANKKKCSTFLHIREGIISRVSRNTQLIFPLIIHLQTSHTRARVSHIIMVKSKSIPYHALTLFLPARQGEKEQSVSTWNQASSQELTTCNSLPDYLPGIALEYSSSTSYASRKNTTSA
ncbi:hypothetical protein ACFXTH_000980 [Malus domestica]